MKLNDISLEEADDRCKAGRLLLQIGPFNFRIGSIFNDVSKNIYTLYNAFPLLDDDAIIDFEISVDRSTGIRRWFKPQAFFNLDGKTPFLPLPASQAFPFLEWGMNWCIAQHAHQYLMIHSAVLEKNGKAIILPAESGSGKSTLTAILATHGWRLLSDEMALINTHDGYLTPIVRPISLKNQSINVVKGIDPALIISDIIDDTNKGTICHLKASDESVSQINNKVKPSHIIFPKYNADSTTRIDEVSKAQAFMRVIENSFNYSLLAEQGFKTLDNVIRTSECFSFEYSQTEDALSFFDSLVS